MMEKQPQLPHNYKVGDFVLLKQLKIQGPRPGMKLKPLYYPDPYRIIRRYETNVMLVPYTKRLMTNRIKGEGRITKNMCTLARISRLRPITNPLRMMDLKVSEKILMDFANLLHLEELPNQMEVIPNPGLNVDPIIKDYQPSLILCSGTSQEIVSNSDQIQLPAQNIIPRNQMHKNQICFLQTLIPGHTDDILLSPAISKSQSESFISHPLDKIVPRTNWWPQLHDTSTDFTSDTGGNIITILQEVALHSISSQILNEEHHLMQPENTPPLSPDLRTDNVNVMGPDNITPVTPPTTRPIRRTKQITSREPNTLTSLKLPSGKTLILSTQTAATTSIQDVKKTKKNK